MQLSELKDFEDKGKVVGIDREKHTVSNRWGFLSNVFLSFSSEKDRTNNAKTKQH